MKKLFVSIGLFLSVASIYFAMATDFTFQPKWAIDYFNLLSESLLEGHLDIVNPPMTYDLIYFQNRWYAPWGVLVSLFLIPLQVIKGRFVPPVYLSLMFASLNVVVFYWLLVRIKAEFFKTMRQWDIAVVSLFYAFGTMNFYVGTLGSAWHVDQMVSSFFGVLSLYCIFKRQRRVADYLWSILFLVPTFLGHATLVLLSVIPATLYVWDLVRQRHKEKRLQMIFRGLLIFGLPMGIGSGLFFFYNYLRFHTIFEYGYRYIHEAPVLENLRLTYGVMSLFHFPRNVWYFALELPKFRWAEGLHMDINLFGNSIFFLSPPLLFMFLASPITRRRGRILVNPYVLSLILGAVITLLPSLMLYSTGWMQFGYRYALDIVPVMVLLTVFGLKGKLHWAYSVGTCFAIVFHVWGIRLLM